MTPTREQRIEHYEKSLPHVQILYADPSSGEILRYVFTKYKLNEELYDAFAIAVGDVILGFYAVRALPHLLSERLELPEVITTHMADDLRNFLAPLEDTLLAVRDNVLEEVAPSRIPVQETPVPATMPKPTPTESEARPLTREELLTALATKRDAVAPHEKSTPPPTHTNTTPVYGYAAYRSDEKTR